jgi:hypothetical protein
MKKPNIEIPMINIVYDIKRLIYEQFNIDIDRKTRVRPVVESRFMYYKILREHLNFSLNEIAATVDYDHATVLHGLRQFENLYKYDAIFRDKFVSFEKLCNIKLGLMANPYDKYLGKEDQLQRQVIRWVNMQYPDAFIVHIPNEGRRSNFERYKFKQLGGVSGMPDLMIFNPTKKRNGLAIELKVGYNKPTENQLHCLKKLQGYDWEAFWSNDFEYIQQRINSYFQDN